MTPAESRAPTPLIAEAGGRPAHLPRPLRASSILGLAGVAVIAFGATQPVQHVPAIGSVTIGTSLVAAVSMVLTLLAAGVALGARRPAWLVVPAAGMWAVAAFVAWVAAAANGRNAQSPPIDTWSRGADTYWYDVELQRGFWLLLAGSALLASAALVERSAKGGRWGAMVRASAAAALLVWMALWIERSVFNAGLGRELASDPTLPVPAAEGRPRSR